MLPIKGHCSYLGETGYNYHSRNFFKSLAKIYPDVKIRNFTVCNKKNQYIDNLDKQILSEQTLFTEKTRKEYPILDNAEILDKDLSGQKINIVLNPVNHYYFFDTYYGPKIAYVVWETTLFPKDFFNKLLEFDQLWVPSQWQKDNAVKQGYPKDRIFIVPEGLDEDLFEVHDKNPNNSFNFLLCGRWEYRKSTKEIIETFLHTFQPSENVNLILNVDNQFSKISTLEQLKQNGFEDNRLVIKSFLSRIDYIKLLKVSQVLITCSRGEGWNRPLHEALAIGTPAIYSNYGPQLEFAMDSPLKVNILDERCADFDNKNENLPGNWCEPDFKHLAIVMRESYDNYQFYKNDAIGKSKQIQENYKSDNIALNTKVILNQISKNNDIIFVTGGDKGYFPIIEKLVKSVGLFSKYKIVTYGINKQTTFESDCCINKSINLIQTKDSDKWYFKQRICLKALEDFPDYSKFVWIDGDSVVNDNIDNVCNYFNDLEDYPISDVHHLKEYYFFDIDKKGNRSNETVYNELLIKEFGIKRNSDILAHACFFIFNKKCDWFFKEIIDVYENLKAIGNDKIIICNDEGIDNLLRWKYGFKKLLPQSNFETGFNFEYITDFFTKNGPYDFNNPGGWTFIPEDKSKVIYFHGNKNDELSDNIIDLILNHQNNIHRFYVSSTQLVDFKKLDLTGSVLDVAQSYGWFAATYHEIFNLKDYNYINEFTIDTDDIVVDLGANFGVFSRYAKSKRAKIFAFEPHPDHFKLLKLNLPNEEVFQCALSNVCGQLPLYCSSHIGGSTLINMNDTDKPILVNCFTLDYFFEAELFDHIDFLKIDIEGSEFELFEGISNKNLLNIKKIVLEYHHCFWSKDNNKRSEFLQRFLDLGFKSYTLYLGNNEDLQILYLWR